MNEDGYDNNGLGSVASNEAGLSSLRDGAASASPPKASIPNAFHLGECWLTDWSSKCYVRYLHVEVSKPYAHQVFVTVHAPEGWDDDDLNECLWPRTQGSFIVRCTLNDDGDLVADPRDFHRLATPALVECVRLSMENDAALAQGMSARQSQDPEGLGPQDASPVAAGHAPELCIASPNPTTKGESN